MKIKNILRLMLLLFFVLSFLWLLRAFFLGIYPDFVGYYYGPHLMIADSNPYLGNEILHTTYVYPPIVLLIFTPFLLFDFSTASIIWTLINFLLLFLSLFFLAKIFEIKFFSDLNLLLMSLVFASFPVKFTLGMGQINLLILFLLVLSLFYIKKGREYLGGIFLGLSIAIKLFPIFLPLYLLVKFGKRRNAVIIPWTRIRIWFSKRQLKDDLVIIDALITVGLITFILIFLFVPVELYKEFFLNTLPSFLTSWKTDYYNQSLSGFIGRTFGTDFAGSIIKTVSSFVIATIAFIIITKNEDESFKVTGLKFGTLITLSLIINNFSWQHHFVWMIIPFYATIAFLDKIKNAVFYYLLLFVSYFLISLNLRLPESLNALLQSHVLYGAVILLVLQLFLLTKHKKTY